MQHELLLFAAAFFLLGAADEIAMDIVYIWLRFRGRIKTFRFHADDIEGRPLSGPSAVLIPAWREQAVIADTIGHILAVWPQADLRLYVGCYNNDLDTQLMAERACAGDDRARVIVHPHNGPTCKADCLNHLYRAMAVDEDRSGKRFRMVVLHDAEDMVDAAALPLLDGAIQSADFVQLPVLPLPQVGSPLIAGHYCDEFAESHAKAMVVRSVLGRGIPGAGVGSGINRAYLEKLDRSRGGIGPFTTGSLTEDYLLGLQLAQMGARSLFLRARTNDGRLVATRAYFPTTMRAAIRQKARWIHGIAFQGWDRLGWRGSPISLWMQLRDRRGPMAALLLALGYLLVALYGFQLVLEWLGLVSLPPVSEGLFLLLVANVAALIWRLCARALFTAREYGLWQGVLAVPRVVVSNTIAIVAARRAVFSYARAIFGREAKWDKTDHALHPVAAGEAASSKQGW